MAVGLAVAFVAAGAYVTVRMQLQASLDDSLRERAARRPRSPTRWRGSDVPPSCASAPPTSGWPTCCRPASARSLDNVEPGTAARRARAGRGQGRERPTASGRCGSAPRTTAWSRCRPARTARRWCIAQSLEQQQNVLARLGIVMLCFGARRRARRRLRRLAGGAQRPATGAPADRRGRGRRPAPRTCARCRSRATTRSPGWPRRSTRC